MKKYIWLIILGSLLVIGGYFFFIRKPLEDAPLYKTTQPLQKTLIQKVSASGTLEARDQITVGSLVAGRVVGVHVDDNDHVEKGQLLITLDNGRGYSPVKKFKATLDEQ